MDRSAGLDVFLDNREDCCELLLTLGDESVDTCLEVGESLSDSCVQDNLGAGAVSLRTDGTELETVSGEGEWRCTVTVGVITENVRNLRNIDFNTFLTLDNQRVLVGLHDMVEHVADSLAEERRDDCRRCLVGSQTMGVACIHDTCLEQSVVLVDTHQCLNDEHDEAEVVLRGLARSVEQYTGIGRKAPVVVLTRAVDAVEWFLVKQDFEAVLVGNLLHERHEQHVMVDGEVGFLEDRSALKLVWRNLVVAGLYRDAELESLNLKVFHE